MTQDQAPATKPGQLKETERVEAGPGPGRITAGDAAPPRHLALRHVLAAEDGVLLLRHARP